MGVVSVPDERVDKLAAMSKSAKKIPAIVEFYDIAGLVKGANSGEGLGNKFLSHIRETNAIVQVLRCFPLGDILHVENSVDPIRDLEIINTELALKDLETVSKRLEGAHRDAKSGKKEAFKEVEILEKAKKLLQEGVSLQSLKNESAISNLQLLRAKPQLYLLNGKLDDVSDALKDKLRSLGGEYIVIDLSVAENIPELVIAAYKILGLISFFTTGTDETRAWTILKNTRAPQAAGAIHTDFEKKFIRADVINWQKLLDCGSWSAAKQKGLMRTEGKEYIFEDGDVAEIKHG